MLYCHRSPPKPPKDHTRTEPTQTDNWVDQQQAQADAELEEDDRLARSQSHDRSLQDPT